jgi:L-threonylcarbamoyladenylate synthase
MLTDVAEAAAMVRAGGLVAFPTETVYGLGADGRNPAAVRDIFAAKGRPEDNPLILHVADLDQAMVYAEWDDAAAALARRHWPGPLTLVLPARPAVPLAVRAGLPTVALRCPDHPLARELIRLVGGPVAAPSANRSGRPSPTTAQAVWEELAGRIDGVLDGGPCPLGVESTVVACLGGGLQLLRPGALPAEELGLPPLPAVRAPALSPGMRHRHYAPRLPLRVVAARDLAAAWAACPAAALLCTAETAAHLGAVAGPRVHVFAAGPAGRAAELYAALRRLEASGAPCILAEALPVRGRDAATMDRLWRAAGTPPPQAGGPPAPQPAPGG